MNEEFNQNNRMPSRKDIQRQSLASIALVFGLLALIFCFTIVMPMIFGSLAILFAFLSRGDRPVPERRARVGWVLGATSLIIAIFVFIMAMRTIGQNFGGLDNYFSTVNEISQEYAETGELDMDELYDRLYQ